MRLCLMRELDSFQCTLDSDEVAYRCRTRSATQVGERGEGVVLVVQHKWGSVGRGGDVLVVQHKWGSEGRGSYS